MSLSVPMRIVVSISLVLTGWFVTQKILYWIPRIEKPLENYPYWRALIFNPLRYFHAKYMDSDRPKAIRQFVMTPERAFFLNMDRSEQRKHDFFRMNQEDDGGATMVQRFSAHEWIGEEDNDSSSSSRNEKRRLQEYWEDRYPFLKMSSQNRNYGDAGCSLAHLLLWQEKLIDDPHQDYLFVFEDDVRLLRPLRQNSRRKSSTRDDEKNTYPIIQAPDVADIVFLIDYALKRVDVPWESSTDEHAVRVIGGFGAQGYIITRAGALKMIDWLQTSRKPLDLSFFAASSMKVYLPISSQWPAVQHVPKGSARLGLNEK